MNKFICFLIILMFSCKNDKTQKSEIKENHNAEVINKSIDKKKSLFLGLSPNMNNEEFTKQLNDKNLNTFIVQLDDYKLNFKVLKSKKHIKLMFTETENIYNKKLNNNFKLKELKKYRIIKNKLFSNFEKKYEIKHLNIQNITYKKQEFTFNENYKELILPTVFGGDGKSTHKMFLKNKTKDIFNEYDLNCLNYITFQDTSRIILVGYTKIGEDYESFNKLQQRLKKYEKKKGKNNFGYDLLSESIKNANNTKFDFGFNVEINYFYKDAFDELINKINRENKKYFDSLNKIEIDKVNSSRKKDSIIEVKTQKQKLNLEKL